MVSARSVRFSPDAHQQPGGEGDGQPAGVGQRAQPHRGVLIGAAIVRLAPRLEQPPRRGFQHHPHRRRHRLEPCQLGPCHHARVQVRQQSRLFQHPDRHGPHVIKRGVISTLIEPLLGLRPAVLRPIAQREQGLFATQFSAATGDVQDLVGLQVHALALCAQLARNRHERAVMALVPAQMGDRNEDLARIGNRQTPGRAATPGGLQPSIAHARRTGHEVGQIVSPRGQRERCLIDVQRHAIAGAAQHPPQRGR